MSFVRINRRPARTRKVSAPKKEWVSTVNDLSVHRSTAEELSRRHDVHRSRNRAAAQWELREKSLNKRKPRLTSPPGLDQTRLRLFRELFSDRCELQDVLARSDRALAVVKDLFGDAPRTHKGFPSVTAAPDRDSDSELPALQNPDPPTRLSLLSQSLTDQQAMNEVSDAAAEPGEDLQDVGFNRLKRKTCRVKAPAWRTTPQAQQQNVPQTPCNTTSSEDQAALNATAAVQRIKSRQTQSEADQSTALINHILNPDTSSLHSGRKSRSSRTTRGRSPQAAGSSPRSANQSSLELLQDMLAQVEAELTSLEPRELSGPAQWPELQRGRGLTGFSAALVGTLGRIVSHMSRKEDEAQQETQVMQRMEEEMKEQRRLIDALTAECLALRDETAALKAELQQRMPELEQRLDMVILTMGELEKDRDSPGQGGRAQSRREAEGDQKKPPSVSPAVPLSPPHQRNGRAPPAGEARARSPHSDGSRTASGGSPGESDSSRTPSSFASLPETVLPRPASLLTRLSQDAVPGEIAERTRQNAAVRIQLEHNRPRPPQQCVGVNDSSLSVMEDRLQELNRQSAAARTKLLELIEQQRQTTAHAASPSISPIPTHTAATHTAVGRRTPEACVSVFEESQRPNSRATGRRSADAVSPQNVKERRKQSFNTQGDELNAEGWFALSAHVRKLD